MRFKKTEVCQTCAKLKNVCQTCLLDLQYGGLPRALLFCHAIALHSVFMCDRESARTHAHMLDTRPRRR